MSRHLLLVVACLAVVPAVHAQSLITTHDNVAHAGDLKNGTLTLRLYAGVGSWRPEGDAGTAVTVQAFGEEGQGLQIPGPLLRVPVGTTIDASIRNTLNAPLELHGFGSRPMAADQPVVIAPGETHSLKFAAGAAGTYHYWATTTRSTLAQRFSVDTQLSGAFIVDEPGAPADQVFVMTFWAAERVIPPNRRRDPRIIYVINGRGWPYTAKLNYEVGESVRWRVINLTEERHPMHLHGFYYGVEAVGNGLKDTASAAGEERHVVTEVVPVGGTMRMAWTAEREGNWVFHCHLVAHIAPELTLAMPPATARLGAALHHEGHDATGMAGLVVGITVRPRHGSTTTATTAPRRKLTLTMRPIPGRFGKEDGYGFMLDGDTLAVTPGPTLLLTRGEPVQITLVNELPEATAIHWHGIELESYFDGVPNFSGTSGNVAPAIPPGGRFEVRFTPPRSGTFMYHTHSHDETVLAKGLYGALLVLDPGETYDPSTDHVLILGLNGDERERNRQPEGILLNGVLAPQITLKQGQPNRLRLINITANNAALTFVVMRQVEMATWKAIAKDGADLSESLRRTSPARQLVTVGETYDFELTPSQGAYWIEVRRGTGMFLIQARVVLAR